MNKITETDQAMAVNNLTYDNFYKRLKLLATSLIEWEGLDEIAGRGSSRFLEQVLFEDGIACFVKDPEYNYLTLRALLEGNYNIYEIPVETTAYSFTYNKTFKTSDIVLIYNNDLMIPTRELITSYVYRLYEVERITDVNLNAQRTPVLLEGSTKTAMTLRNLYTKFIGNMPFIIGRKDFGIKDKINAVDTKAPYLVDKLDLHKQRLWNEVMTVLGINNSNTDKKERLLVDEVNSNNQLIGYYLNTYLKTREQAKDEINNMFFNGEEKVKVKVNDNILNTLESTGFIKDDNEEVKDE